MALLHVVAMEAEVAPQAGADEAGAAAGADAGDEPGADASGKPGASPGPATSTAGDAPHAHAPTAAVLAAAAGSCPALERLGGGTAGGEVDRPADAAVSGAERSLRAVLRLLQCAAGDTAAMTPGQPGAAASARLLEALLQVRRAVGVWVHRGVVAAQPTHGRDGGCYRGTRPHFHLPTPVPCGYLCLPPHCEFTPGR